MSSAFKISVIVLFVLFLGFAIPSVTLASYRFENFRAKPPIHRLVGEKSTPAGLTPSQIKMVYHLPENGGHGTIAIVTAYDNPYVEQDLNVFNRQFNLPMCTGQNGCFEKHKMDITHEFRVNQLHVIPL